MSAEAVQAVAEAHPNYGTGSRDGVRCLGCSAPITAPNGNYTHGWALHVAETAVAAARPAIEREAKAAAWDEGFADGLRQDGEGADGPRYVNPYRIEREGQA